MRVVFLEQKAEVNVLMINDLLLQRLGKVKMKVTCEVDRSVCTCVRRWGGWVRPKRIVSLVAVADEVGVVEDVAGGAHCRNCQPRWSEDGYPGGGRCGG